ncbi:EFCAB14 [Branchiostoma lanceolatum]|uniref:EFCAB14 protein n=1 Tax=Branchiostoma lanceolatum TaxID=7740 RepID=A0A8K0EC20_BRALA|nr:EFCAB14 [Branchiostoma lanceolatum]
MKKRKELDALVSGKLTKKKREGHELLRSTGSDSSDLEEFSLPVRKSGFSKRHSRCRLCTRSCFPLCIFVLMTACIVTSGGLVWMHLDLKKDLDNLREHLARVEQSEMAMPGQVEQLKQNLKHQDDRLETLSTGETGLSVANKHLAQLDKQIAKLNKTTISISASVSSSQKLVALPSTVEDLSKQMASIGSEIESMKEEMSTTTSTQRQLQQQVEDMRAELDQLKRNEAVTDVPASAAVAPVPGVSPTTLSPVQQLTAAATKARAELEDGGVLGSYVEKEVASLTEMVHQLNDTLQACANKYSVAIADLSTNMSVLTNRVSVLEGGGVSVTSGNVTHSPMDLLQLRADMDKLLQGVGGGNSTAGLGDNSFNTLMTQIRNITVTMEALKAQVTQSQADDLNDLNSNLLSNRTVASLQGILAKAANQFKKENGVKGEELTQLEEAVHNLWEITSQHSNDMVVVKAQVNQLLGTVQNVLDNMDMELQTNSNFTAGNNTLDIGTDIDFEDIETPDDVEWPTVVEPTMNAQTVELTECQRENLEAVESDLLGVYIPQCLEDGRYQPLQCNPSTGYCWCVDQYGQVIEGTNLGMGTLPNCKDYSAEVVTSPSVSIQSLLSSTKAILDGLESTKPAQANKTDVAEILLNGTLATHVNDSSLNVTVSFNVTELDITLHDGNGTNTTAIMSLDGELHDGNETLHGGNGTLNETEAVGNVTEPTVVTEVTTEWPHLPPMNGYETPHALEIGFFRWDVNGDGHVNYEDMADFLGPKLPRREDLMAFDANGNGQLELPEFYRAFGFHEEPMHIPTEEEEMAENSDEAEENLPPVLAGKRASTDSGETKCMQARLEAQTKALIGQYVPQCTEDGRYRPLQCHASTGYCWCVDELGTTIEGTKAGRGMIPHCDESFGEPLPIPVEADGDADSEGDINSLSNLLKDFKRSQPDPTN